MTYLLKSYWSTKQASLTTDVIGSSIYPVLGSQGTDSLGDAGRFAEAANTVGEYHGLLTDDDDIPNDKAGLLPGVGSSRVMRRARKVRKDLYPEGGYQASRIFFDHKAPATNALLLMALGAGGGAMAANKGNRGFAAGVGALGGLAVSSLSNLIAVGMAAGSRRRTKEEQRAAEQEPGILGHVIPGRGTYNWWKRLGYSSNYDRYNYRQ